MKKKYLYLGIFILLIVACGTTFLITDYNYTSRFALWKIQKEDQINQLSNEKNLLESKTILLGKKIEEKEGEIEGNINFFNTYTKAYTYVYMATSEGGMGDYYYQLASAAYNDATAPYQYTIDYCVEARKYYLEAHGDYNQGEALFKKAGNTAPDGRWKSLTEEYSLLMDSGSKIALYMYETCEYFEIAALKYGYWVEYKDDAYREAGDKSREKANEKIRLHDDEILLFNKYLAEINAIIETW